MLKKLVAWLPQEAIRDSFSEAFIITGDNKFRVILDYAKVSIERSKALEYCNMIVNTIIPQIF